MTYSTLFTSAFTPVENDPAHGQAHAIWRRELTRTLPERRGARRRLRLRRPRPPLRLRPVG